MLTDAQVSQYHENGYTIPNYRLPDETLADICRDHDRLIQNHPEFRNYCPNVLAYDLSFLNYARAPEILDMVEQVIGADFALWNSSFFAKPALDGKRRPGIRTVNIGPYDHQPLALYGWRLTMRPWTTDV